MAKWIGTLTGIGWWEEFICTTRPSFLHFLVPFFGGGLHSNSKLYLYLETICRTSPFGLLHIAAIILNVNLNVASIRLDPGLYLQSWPGSNARGDVPVFGVSRAIQKFSFVWKPNAVLLCSPLLLSTFFFIILPQGDATSLPRVCLKRLVWLSAMGSSTPPNNSHGPQALSSTSTLLSLWC